MINGIDLHGVTQKSGQNIRNQKAPSPSAAKTSASVPSNVPRPAVPMAAGLPADRLSSSIVSFAKFFSLPLKQNMLAVIRRQVFSVPLPPADTTPNTAAGKAFANSAANTQDTSTAARKREALSLAAAAAESKGVELQPKGLESYAKAVDPEWEKQKDGERQRGKRNKHQNEQEEKLLQKASAVTAGEIERAVNENVLNDPLLDMLNRLPGKNGQRWIVLPFCFSEGDRDFRVSMRIMMENENAVCMVMDIAEDSGRWVFMLEAAGDQLMKAAFFPRDEISHNDISRLKGELSKFTGIPVNRIYVKCGGSCFPCEGTERFPSVYEAV